MSKHMKNLVNILERRGKWWNHNRHKHKIKLSEARVQSIQELCLKLERNWNWVTEKVINEEMRDESLSDMEEMQEVPLWQCQRGRFQTPEEWIIINPPGEWNPFPSSPFPTGSTLKWPFLISPVRHPIHSSHAMILHWKLTPTTHPLTQ